MMTIETIEYTKNRIELQRKLIKLRQDDYKRTFDEAVAAHRWSQVAGLDGIVTGLMMADNLLRDELRELEHFSQVVVAVKS